jgi:Zn-dependent protease
VLLAPDPTPYDLRWRMFGVRIRVHPLFWVMAALIGFFWTRFGFQYWLLWVGCVFVSVLLHELGHVFMGRLFGSPGHIVLFSFGGLAIGSGDVPRRHQRVLVSAAGPLAQLLLVAPLVLGLMQLGTSFGWDLLVPYRDEDALVLVLKMLLEINLFWPLLNLLPIYPLDGGQITREVCEGASPERGRVVSLGISAVVSGLLAVNSLTVALTEKPLIPYLEVLGSFYMGIFFALFCVSSFQALQAEQSRRRPGGWDDDLPPWER